jgi:hypothetical protein
MGAPKTLPLDYFDKQSSSDSEPAPKTLPLDYFDKQDPAATAPKDSFTSGFLQQSGAEPSLKEQKESTEGFYHSLFTNPRATLKETGAAGFDQLIQFSQDVHEHLTGKPELEGMVAAAPHFKKGEYAKGVAAYLSKVIPFGFGAPFGAAAEGRPKEAAGRVASEAIQLATMRGGPVESVENMAEGVVGGPLREISGTGPAATEEAAASAAKDAQEAQGAHAARVADVTDANRSELARSRQAHEERVSDIEGENARTQAAHQEAVSRIRQANTEAQAAVRGGQAAEQTATKLADTVSEALPAIADAETAKAKAAYPKIDATMSSDTLYGGLQDIVDETLKGSGNVPMSITRILKDVSSSDTGASGFGRSTGPTVGGRHFNLNDQGDLKAYQNMKSRGVFTEDEIARMEGHLEGKPISFDDLHGMYSELGR